ncbi:MAG: iron-sulfur cluster biosynthesis family protein [Flammeovirgaceae bacterium]
MVDSPVSITSNALKEVKYILAHKNIPQDYGLRIGVRGGGGCGTTSFFLGFDQEKEFDKIYDVEGIKLIVDKRQFMYILDLQLDFEERETERGFVFNKQVKTV